MTTYSRFLTAVRVLTIALAAHQTVLFVQPASAQDCTAEVSYEGRRNRNGDDLYLEFSIFAPEFADKQRVIYWTYVATYMCNGSGPHDDGTENGLKLLDAGKEYLSVEEEIVTADCPLPDASYPRIVDVEITSVECTCALCGYDDEDAGFDEGRGFDDEDPAPTRLRSIFVAAGSGQPQDPQWLAMTISGTFDQLLGAGIWYRQVQRAELDQCRLTIVQDHSESADRRRLGSIPVASRESIEIDLSQVPLHLMQTPYRNYRDDEEPPAQYAFNVVTIAPGVKVIEKDMASGAEGPSALSFFFVSGQANAAAVAATLQKMAQYCR